MIKKLLIAATTAILLLSSGRIWASPSTPAEIEKALRGALTDERYEYLISLSTMPTSAPETYDSLRIEMVGESQPFGNCWFKVFFYANNVVTQNATLNAQVHWYQEALVTTRSIPRGEALTPDMFTVMRREIYSLNDPYIAGVDETEGKEASRSIPQGKTMSYSMVKPEEVIKRGDHVTIMFHSGSLQITATGEARQAGSRGESIKVKNLLTNKIIVAEVQDEQLVKVVR
ncbi:MAG: flagellar basal body P-ring formation chaperone FlgA [Candidatus Zixiibacteriota bacterium]